MILINIYINKEKIKVIGLPKASASGKILNFSSKEFGEFPFERELNSLSRDDGEENSHFAFCKMLDIPTFS